MNHIYNNNGQQKYPLPSIQGRLGTLEEPLNVVPAPQRVASSHSLRRPGKGVGLLLFALLFCFVLPAGAQQATFISDAKVVPSQLVDEVGRKTGLTVHCLSGLAGQKLKGSDVVERTLRNTKGMPVASTRVILLQLGCNDVPDAWEDKVLLSHYEQTLFDFPTGDVCTLTGKMKRHKRMAVSKAKVGNSDFAGAYYRIVLQLRKSHPDARLFMLSPHLGKAAQGNAKLDSQLALVAQMFCIPYVRDVDADLVPYNFIWNKNTAKPKLGKMLLIGDSYCEQRRWTDQLELIADVELVNLGVTSATMKDKSDFRSAPYTAYPVKTDNAGNHNTLSSQIELLKRLRKGKNLRAGEQPIADDYRPDYILIEGGTNDNADELRTEQNYDTDACRNDRTTYMGALAYLTSEVHRLYPQAKIYIVTPAGLYYGHTDEPFAYITKCRQIRKAAQLLGYPTVNWDRESRLSFVFNNSAGTGNGSASKPFRYNAETIETRDLLHPNERGGRFFAEAVVKSLR